jgi:hypothetical protein
MPESKTKPTDFPVTVFINTIPDAQMRADCWIITQMMMEAAQGMPRMWGTSIVGFGLYRAVNLDGKEESWMQIGFSPRKRGIALYVMLNALDHSTELLEKLGKYTHGKGCLYIKSLADVNLQVLNQLFHESVASTVKANPIANSKEQISWDLHQALSIIQNQK